MEAQEKSKITIEAIVHAPLTTVWNTWITPDDIIQWNTASNDWHTTKVENDLRVGGRFTYRMEAKDGTMGFDFAGVYENIITHQHIAYSLGDDRKVTIDFSADHKHTKVVETFDAEPTHSLQLQQAGWQSILNNFKRIAESKLH